ncbi:protein-cysteine N-palmitoyltransferase Rasp isoform X2 [Phymastichus coffea]|uniref:protein-cysteine N-palmitoyltransferase Rasp isoform X2 n=1 Tax=Phymastichus coffea TaxID=108790 RepID=UPI00273BE002|nr:protein-cysteine N-palmitoyltransferase Rasp isoform X2 [Phymastichus coffea]
MTKLPQQFSKLPIWEISFYALVWTAAVFYSIYSVYLVTNDYFNDYFDDAYNDFEIGWSFIQRKIDISDEEWRMWIPFIFKLSPWVLVQVLISQQMKLLFHNTEILCLWYSFVSIAFLLYYFGLTTTFCTLLLPLTSCLLTVLKSKALSWIVHCITLFFIYHARTSKLFQDWIQLHDEQFFMLSSAICWIQLRSISYSIDSIVTYNRINIFGFMKDLLQNIAYCLYLPTLFLGPVILYEQFTHGLKKPFTRWTKTKTIKILGNIARYLFWMFFTHLSMHFIYFNALKYQPMFVETLQPWAFYGYGYCMGQYFFNKYVVVYGLTCTVSRAEDIDAPPPPKCIGRIHLYSDMWKYFDNGLYKFLLRYIYIPLNPMSDCRKFVASIICFIFIYFWHGMQYFIFIWSFLNFSGILIEMIAKSLSSYFYKSILRDSLSLSFKRRLECALASPLLALSAVSNFYFVAGKEIGHMFALRTAIQDSWEIRILMLFILYCSCQVSTEIKQFEHIYRYKYKICIKIQ